MIIPSSPFDSSILSLTHQTNLSISGSIFSFPSHAIPSPSFKSNPHPSPSFSLRSCTLGYKLEQSYLWLHAGMLHSDLQSLPCSPTCVCMLRMRLSYSSICLLGTYEKGDVKGGLDQSCGCYKVANVVCKENGT